MLSDQVSNAMGEVMLQEWNQHGVSNSLAPLIERMKQMKLPAGVLPCWITTSSGAGLGSMVIDHDGDIRFMNKVNGVDQVVDPDCMYGFDLNVRE